MAEPSRTSDWMLTEEERRRLRAEAQFLAVAAREAQPPEPPKSRLSRVLGYLSNGFVLLLVGSLITSFLVPSFQKRAEARKEQVQLMKDCLSSFFGYSNSLWLELHTLVPLAQKYEIDEETYLRQLNRIAPIRQARADAIARARALTAVFEIDNPAVAGRSLTAALDDYAAQVDAAAQSIEAFLNGLYCTPLYRDASPCATFDPDFDAHRAYLELQQRVADIGNRAAATVAEQIAARIGKP